MIIPQYWAEASSQQRQKGRQITVRRFGWSDNSQAEAQANAEARAREALQRLVAGEKLLRREPRRPYNGAAGVPIREEIVSRHGSTIVTRNSYGARCLNTPNVLFADIDHEPGVPKGLWLLSFGVLAAVALATATAVGSVMLGAVLMIVAIAFTGLLASAMQRLAKGAQGGPERVAQRRLDRFLLANPSWAIRLYRTPAGLRLLVTHQPFLPADTKVAEFFRAVGADPVYVRMCLNQQCFRARVSPKPWRIGISQHMKPRPGVWPVSAERMRDRTAWITRYEAAATSYAACAFEKSAGSGVVHPEIAPVLELHDALCRATGGLPTA